MAKKTDSTRDVATILRDHVLIEKALAKAARQAIAEHKTEGLPLAVWRDGKVVWLSAEELEAELPSPGGTAPG